MRGVNQTNDMLQLVSIIRHKHKTPYTHETATVEAPAAGDNEQ